LEEHVSAGRKAAIIHKYGIFFDPNRYVGSGENTVQATIDFSYRSKSAELAATLDKGIPLDKGSLLRDCLDSGYLDKVLEMNLAQPDSVRNLLEPQKASGVWRSWNQRLFQARREAKPPSDIAELVKSERMRLRFLIGNSRERCGALAGLVRELREQNAELAIVVPRGLMDQGMVSLFGKSEFDITFAASQSDMLPVLTQAVIESFSKASTIVDVEIYKALADHYGKFTRQCEKNATRGTPNQEAADALEYARLNVYGSSQHPPAL